MTPLLFLVHRIPFPPNKGDKIRSFNFLKRLSEQYAIHLGTFIDNVQDRSHIDALRPFCRAIKAVQLNPLLARLSSSLALLSDRPLSLAYYWSRDMDLWVRGTVGEHRIRHALAYSSTMAQYVEDLVDVRRVADFVDVDSDKWAQYAETTQWPMSWIYRREARTLAAYERDIAMRFAATTLVSEEEAALLRKSMPATASKVFAVPNGVDTDFFAPDENHVDPYGTRAALVFTGAMDYWANVDAVEYFARDIFTHIRAKQPDIAFYIVGSNPTARVEALAKLPGVTVTGSVDDIRPYLQWARCAVAPLRIARGVQNKVLEAMAMGTPVVATPQALEGIPLHDQLSVWTAHAPQAFAAAVLEILRDQGVRESAMVNRSFVQSTFSWASSSANLGELLSGAA